MTQSPRVVRLPRRYSDAEKHPSRAWIWLHQLELDRQLAQGVDPSTSAPLQARAQRIVTEHFRHELVAHLHCIQARAEHPPHWHSATLPVCAAEIRAGRGALDALAGALRDATAPAVRGVALAACLINDPHGPLHQPSAAAGITALAADATSHLAPPAADPVPASGLAATA